MSTERGEASACPFAGPNSDIRWCDFQESSKRAATMRSLIVVTILCLASTPAFACVFNTDCNPGATCLAGVCSDQRGFQNDDQSSSSARDNAPTKRSSQGRCIKGSGMQGVCIGG